MSNVERQHPDNHEIADAYWRANIRLLLILMAIWFMVSFGAGILFRDFLDQFMLEGYPLGFWFAQQGSIYIFIALIAFYAWRMHHIERAFALDDDDDDEVSSDGGENPVQ